MSTNRFPNKGLFECLLKMCLHMQREEEVSNFIFLLYHSLSGPFLNIGSLILPSPCPFSTSPHFHHLLLNHLSQTPGICDHTIRRTPPWQSSLAHSDVLRSELLWYSVHTCSSHLYWKAPGGMDISLPASQGARKPTWGVDPACHTLCSVFFIQGGWNFIRGAWYIPYTAQLVTTRHFCLLFILRWHLVAP